MRVLVVSLLALWATSCGDDDGGGGGHGSDGGAGGGRDGSSAGADGGGASGGDGLAGSPCASAGDCTHPAMPECFTTVSGGGFVPDMVFPGGYCSRGCAMDPEGGGEPVDCGPGATCTSLGTSGGMISTRFELCAKTCAGDADCRVTEGYACKIVFPGFPGVCMPPGL